MTHGPTYYPSKGACIYCGAMDVQLNDEHVVPYALGGQHVLRAASCAACEDITKKFEQKVARDLWGDARTSFNTPTRRRKERKSHVEMSDPKDLIRKHNIPVAEYPGGLAFYKMGPCGFFQGLPETEDISGSWQLVMIDDEARRNAFFNKHGYHAVHRFRNVLDGFGRMLAKIGYCQILTALDPGDFNPLVLPYITGVRKNVSYFVGSAVGLPEPDNGYRLTTLYSEGADRMILVVEIRLYANTHAPTYHVVVGDVSGHEQVLRAKAKIECTS